MPQTLFENQTFLWIIGIIVLWEIVWKAIGLWKTGRNNQPVWFIAILIFNTLGILAIIYLMFFQKKSES